MRISSCNLIRITVLLNALLMTLNRRESLRDRIAGDFVSVSLAAAVAAPEPSNASRDLHDGTTVVSTLVARHSYGRFWC